MPSCTTRRTPRSSPTSRPTTSTTRGPRRPMQRRSTTSPPPSTRRVPGLLRGRRRCRGAGGATASDRPARGDRVDAARRGRRRTGGAGRGHALGARGPLPRRRVAGARRRADPGIRRRTAGQWHRVVHRDAASDGAQGRGGGRPGLRQLRAPPDRDRRRPRLRSGAGRRGPAARGVPAAPGLAHPDVRSRDGRGAGRGRRGGRLRRLPGPRGCRPPGDGCAGGEPYLFRPSTSPSSPTSKTYRRPSSRGPAPATWC